MKGRIPLLFVLLTAVHAYAGIAPSFDLPALSGSSRISLKSSLKPGRLVLVSFWATWCAPCLDELKYISDGLKSVSVPIPLDVVAINVDTPETASEVRSTARLHRISFPIALDPSQEILARYRPDKAIPFSVLISPSGKVEASFSGYREGMLEEIRAVAKRVLK